MATPKNLLAQQQKASQASAVVGGVSNLLSQGLGMVNSANSIQTNAPDAQIDTAGKPIFNLGEAQQNTAAINPQGASGSEVASGALSGASAGAAFGPWGAAIGGVFGGASALIFGKKRKNRANGKKQLAEGNLFTAQKLYNQGIMNYNTAQSSQAAYRDSVNTDQRMNNLYTFNNQ